MKNYNDYDQVDIFSPKSFLSSLSPKSPNLQSNKLLQKHTVDEN